MRVKASYTVEAALICPLLCFILCGIMIVTLNLYKQVQERKTGTPALYRPAHWHSPGPKLEFGAGISVRRDRG